MRLREPASGLPSSPFNTASPWVLVTRPAPDHAALIEQLEAAGYRPLHCPAFELVPAAGAADLDRRVSSADIALVTSPAAARILVSRLGHNPAVGCRFYAPGRTTAGILRSAGLDVEFVEAPNASEALVALDSLRHVEGLRALVLGAAGGRRLFADTLSERGATVDAVEIYRRRPLNVPNAVVGALRGPVPVITLISSRLAFDAIAGGLDPADRHAWLAGRFIVSSERIERHCRSQGARSIRRAAGAGDPAMLKALAELR